MQPFKPQVDSKEELKQLEHKHKQELHQLKDLLKHEQAKSVDQISRMKSIIDQLNSLKQLQINNGSIKKIQDDEIKALKS